MDEQLEMKIGKTLTAIRLDQGIERREIDKSVISRSHLYRLENGEHIPSFLKICRLLEKYSISLAEFEFLLKDRQLDDTQIFLNKFKEVGDSGNINKLINLDNEIADYLKSSPNKFLHNLQLVINGYITFEKTGRLKDAQDIFRKIWGELEQKDNWYYYDIILMTNIFYIFDFPTLDYVFSRLMKVFEVYKGYGNIHHIKKVALFNYCTLLRLNGRIKETRELINEVESLCKLDNDLLTIIRCDYHRIEYDYSTEKINRETGENKVQELTTVLERFGYLHISLDMQDDWKKLTYSTI
ncbi:helix-turn-helix domain-containing protein [Listeria costaricensis]|uniref:helix-turn-helix domain-containing protein n=1 Tax=Listeria costaricensis TaxID=2026604 RepID=UPI0013C4C7D1|nr:helix-turn-helix transcriptional regulator [Listeria costaricensis]